MSSHKTDGAGALATEVEAPISERVNVDKLPAKGLAVTIRPDAELRSVLAEFNGLVAIEDFHADITVKRWQRDGVRVSGSLVASIVQTCTVTLEPVSQTVDCDIDAVYIASGSRLEKTIQSGEAHEIIVDPEGDDTPELYEHPWLDVGDVVQEFFALGIDPWPRAPGAEFETGDATADKPEKPNPFAALAPLKDRL